MSCLNDNGKGNMLLSYLFPSDDTIANIDIERKINNELSKLATKLKSEGLIKRWVIAPDDMISEKVIEIGESILDDWIPIENNCELPPRKTPVLVSLAYPNGEELVDIDELNEVGNWEMFGGYITAWKYKPTVYKKK